MTYHCGFDGTATVVRHHNAYPEWTRTDDRIHIVSELVDDTAAMSQIRLKYEVGAWCPEANAYHATLIEETP